ncbi:MAG: carbohydrate ABC transporter permease [Clostridiales bacterium]|nr:carbohydrate ABC transporter permease [Clostridiales bacterium]
MIENKSFGDRTFNFLNTAFLTLLACVFLYPMLYIIAISFSAPIAVLNRQVWLYPVDISFESYKTVFESEVIAKAYANTIYYTVVGTVFELMGTTLLAYPLSKKRLIGRRYFSFFFYFTNIFNGGMIPTYLVIKNLKMVDTIWALVIPGCISVYYAIILRTNFENIPVDLEEAAKIDGMGNWAILAKIYVPLSKPIYAALTLFFAIGFWNSYMQPLIYLNNANKYPLQIVLRNIVLAGSLNDLSGNAVGSGAMVDMRTIGETMKAAAIMVVMVPVMCIYPFVQKYFVKGIMIGAVKG